MQLIYVCFVFPGPCTVLSNITMCTLVLSTSLRKTNGWVHVLFDIQRLRWNYSYTVKKYYTLAGYCVTTHIEVSVFAEQAYSLIWLWDNHVWCVSLTVIGICVVQVIFTSRLCWKGPDRLARRAPKSKSGHDIEVLNMRRMKTSIQYHNHLTNISHILCFSLHI